jgi:hypothetical protein
MGIPASRAYSQVARLGGDHKDWKDERMANPEREEYSAYSAPVVTGSKPLYEIPGPRLRAVVIRRDEDEYHAHRQDERHLLEHLAQHLSSQCQEKDCEEDQAEQGMSRVRIVRTPMTRIKKILVPGCIRWKSPSLWMY